MAKNKKEIAVKPIEVSLWDAAIKLRGSLESAEYKYLSGQRTKNNLNFYGRQNHIFDYL